jgi:hypothetical protein
MSSSVEERMEPTKAPIATIKGHVRDEASATILSKHAHLRIGRRRCGRDVHVVQAGRLGDLVVNGSHVHVWKPKSATMSGCARGRPAKASDLRHVEIGLRVS